MTFWAEVFLGVIAFATVTMALIQVSVIVFGWMLARRVNRLMGQIEREMKPLADSVNAMARDAARATSLAAGQVERIDKLIGDLASKIEETASTVQDAIVKPLHDGAAMMAGVRAAIEIFREVTGRLRSARTRNDEEDALFVG